MSYYIIGSNYELADTSFSSRVAFDNTKKQLLTQKLIDNKLADSVLILSTCNRSEVFVFCSDVIDLNEWVDQINEQLLEIHQLDDNDLKYFYCKVNNDACMHLFRVVCGLDSLVLGESQITAQLKDAFKFTQEFHNLTNTKLPSEFYSLISLCFACAKEVRTKTTLGKFAVSIAYMACKIARNLYSDFTEQKILLIGASQTNLLLARHLIRNGINNLIIANRTLSNAKKFVAEINCGQAHDLTNLDKLVSEATLIFSSTSAHEFILTFEDLQALIRNRQNKLLIFDLAIPNDIDPEVKQLENIELYNRDDLQKLVDINRFKRIQAIDEALPILNKYLNEFVQQNRIKQGNEIIVEYRNSMHEQRETLLQEAKQAILKGEDPLNVLENFSFSLTNKILHTPTLILSSFIKSGKLCTLSKLHEYLDRYSKDNLQEVIDSTLSKDIFRNNCCKVREGITSEQVCCEAQIGSSQSSCQQNYKSKAINILEDNVSTCQSVTTASQVNKLRYLELQTDGRQQVVAPTAKGSTNTKQSINNNHQTEPSRGQCPFAHLALSKCNEHSETTNTTETTEFKNHSVVIQQSVDSAPNSTPTINHVSPQTCSFSLDSLKGVFVPTEFTQFSGDDNIDNQLISNLTMVCNNNRVIYLSKNSYIEESLDPANSGFGYVKVIK